MKKRMLLLNQHLIYRQGLTDDEVTSLEQLHSSRMDIEDAMEVTDDPTELKALFEDWTLCQFELQKGWKFSEDKSFHMFWTIPKCKCPKLDNSDRYPSGSYIYNLECPIHSSEKVIDEKIKPVTSEEVVSLQKTLEVGPTPGLEIVDFQESNFGIWWFTLVVLFFLYCLGACILEILHQLGVTFV